MSSDDEFSESNCRSRVTGICDDFHLPFERLCTKELTLSNLVNEESDIYKKSIEIHRNETLEAATKVYQDPLLLHSWDNFRHAADLLAVMHRRIKQRMNRVLATAYESGSVAFSKDFLNEFGRILRKSNKFVANRPLPKGMLDPLLMAQSDPPRGAFKRKRRILRIRRQHRSFQAKNTVIDSRSSSGRHLSDNIPPAPEMSRLSEEEVYRQSRSPLSPPVHSSMTPEDFCSCSSRSSSSSSSRTSIPFSFVRYWLFDLFRAPPCAPFIFDILTCILNILLKMGRKKIDIKKISDEKTLLVTFAKRKVGLFNKAFELSELCECRVAILILTNKNRMHKFASHDLSSVVKQYNDRPNHGELMTSQDIIERRKKKKQSKSSQSEDRPLNQQNLSNCDCGTSEYDGGMDDESLVPTATSTNTTAITAPVDYDGQLAQLGLAQHDVRPPLKSFYPADDTGEATDVFQHHANNYAQHYECTVGAVESTSPLKMETDRELNTEGTKPVLPTDLTLTGAASISDTLAKKHPRERLNLGTLRTNRPPAFGDGCKSFDPTISSPLPTNKGRMTLVVRGSTTTDSELCTPEPPPRLTPVIILDSPDLHLGWRHVNAGPTSLSSSEELSSTKSTSSVFKGAFTRVDESNQRCLITPDSEQLTMAPFT
ncbi:Myocyte-specific enhancer factor 2D [Echinococcus granulosus]|uniref:Myocyte-specific enhancer factor 2D n=1 Tax=Echinococcus granulosus TaxID=6210 RepID=W6V099_ECHGR|nr:Myocyte-specific enhancer factor 2D [Echinococcus granulosus]EUB59399.1 Myocyte-specific enhancer factor 2D [Echinococcus granulosus]